jgi:putative peptidoglycan lipid II flippase
VTAGDGELAPAAEVSPQARRTGGAAAIIAVGILISRIFGIVRQSLMATYLGASPAGDAFVASFKITNILQNLFGEGVLSASFVPVYSKLLAQGDDAEADRVAGAIAALLALVVAVLVLLAIVATPALMPLIATGLKDERRELAIHLTRILWIGAGAFVLSAWCLGVLNSHRKFRLPYLAPVLWNVAMIGALLWAGPRQGQRDLAETLAWASVGGAFLQLLVQVPTTLALIRHFRLAPELQSPHVREIVRNFGPVFIARGVVQISSYIDNWIATFLPYGMVATVGYATTVSVLPVSLFGMAISTAELPEMSRATGHESEIAALLKKRLEPGLRRIAFFVVPSAVAMIVLGEVISAVLFEHGEFSPRDSTFVWGILAGAGIGLLATTMARLYSSTYYALRDTRTPLRFAVLRIVLTLVLGYVAALHLPRLLGIDPRWGVAALTGASSVAAWIEFALLRNGINRRIGKTGIPIRFLLLLWSAAGAAAFAAWELWMLTRANRFAGGVASLATFGVVYLLATIALGVPEATGAFASLRRRR